jgi:NAD(P)-dependent dehydrogenase (short-subunit alcohol dehydrogenase family)
MTPNPSDSDLAGYEPQSVAGKAIIVTGGTTGIGRAIARLLAARGARLFIFGRHEEELNEALEEIRAAGGEVYGLTADVSRIEDVRRVFQEADERLGGLDVLVNNAGISSEPFEGEELDELEYVVRTNLVGYLACAREATRRMKGRGGHIVNIGSMSADLREPKGSVYVATKAAIQGFSESLRKTVNPDGIKVTLIEPGKVATDMVDQSRAEKEEREEELKMLRPEDIAACVYYSLTQPRRCDIVSVQIRPHLQVI